MSECGGAIKHGTERKKQRLEAEAAGDYEKSVKVRGRTLSMLHLIQYTVMALLLAGLILCGVRHVSCLTGPSFFLASASSVRKISASSNALGELWMALQTWKAPKSYS